MELFLLLSTLLKIIKVWCIFIWGIHNCRAVMDSDQNKKRKQKQKTKKQTNKSENKTNKRNPDVIMINLNFLIF